jgi:hypothetical protein
MLGLTDAAIVIGLSGRIVVLTTGLTGEGQFSLRNRLRFNFSECRT